MTAIEANFQEFLPLFSRTPDAETHADDRIAWFISGLPAPVFNAVTQTRLPERGADRAIRETLARFRARRVPMMWWVGPSSRPADLGERLRSHGLMRTEEWMGMAADLDPLPDDAAPAFLEVQPVRSAGDLDAWLLTFARGFGIGEAIRERLAPIFFACALGPAPAFRLLLGAHEGKPVGTALLFPAAGVAGVYCVSTLPAERRQGIGTALTLAALRQAREMGYGTGILQATWMGLGLYRRLGFRDYCRVSLYEWHGSP